MYTLIHVDSSVEGTVSTSQCSGQGGGGGEREEMGGGGRAAFPASHCSLSATGSLHIPAGSPWQPEKGEG